MSVIEKIFSKKTTASAKCTAVIVAAGNSTRMGRDKILMPLGKKPVIAHTLSAFQASMLVDEIIVVTRAESLQSIADICAQYGIDKIAKVVVGGRKRAESSLIGVLEVSDDTGLVAIHDGARPFPSTRLIERTITAAELSGAAAPAVSATDTVRILNNRKTVVSTPDRDLVALMQTPQVFSRELIKVSLERALDMEMRITDDCSAVEACGHKITVVDGEPTNIKLTSSLDLYIAEKILADRGDK